VQQAALPVGVLNVRGLKKEAGSARLMFAVFVEVNKVY